MNRPSLLLICLAIILAVAGSAPRLFAAGPQFDNAAETTHRSLTWEDFKGKNARETRWSGAWAHSALTTRLSRVDLVTTENESDQTWLARAPSLAAYSVFDKYLSAVGPGARKNVLLAHEQLHFDLAEALALRLTLELRQLSATGESPSGARLALNSAIEASFAKSRDQVIAKQAQYDEETNHGTKKRQQSTWAKIITEELAAARKALAEASDTDP